MDTLRDVDWRAGFELLGRVIEAGDDLDALARAAVEALPVMVASEITTLSVCDLRSGRRQVIGVPAGAISATDRAAFDRHFREHPLVRYHADLRGPGAHRISDSLTFAQFRNSALYSDYYRRIGIDHAIALPVFVDEGTLVSFVLNRRHRDFSERERLLLDVVGVPLARLYLQAAARRRVLNRRSEAPGLKPPRAAAAPRLTPREGEVMGWLTSGKTDREIAALLTCSPRTVQKHLERIYVKLGVETRTAAVMRLLAH
jgi:DNA-binding CsgD family transcriptional regulator